MSKFLLTFFLLLSGYCHASEWWLIALAANSKSVFFMDMSTLKKTKDGETKVWVQGIDIDGSYAMQQYFFKCEDEEYGVKSATRYDMKGNVRSSTTLPFVSYEPVIPSSVNQILFEAACSDPALLGTTHLLQMKLNAATLPIEASKEIFRILEADQKNTKK